MRLRTVIFGAIFVTFALCFKHFAHAAGTESPLGEQEAAAMAKITGADPHCADQYEKNARAFKMHFDEHGFAVFDDDVTAEVMACWVSTPRAHISYAERKLWWALWLEHQYAKTQTKLLEVSLETTRQLIRGQKILHREGQYWRCVPIDPN